jgi:hypothetical protein
LPAGPFNTIGFLVSLLAFNSFLAEGSSASLTCRALPTSDREGAAKLSYIKTSSQAHPQPGWFLLLVIMALFAAAVMEDSTTAFSEAPSQTLSLSHAKLDFTRTATIIEGRNVPHLAPLLIHFLAVLPPQWPMTVFCSPENIEVLKHSPALALQLGTGHLILTVLHHMADLHDGEYLSCFLTKPWFWEQLTAEWLLFFQSDSMICSNSEQSIEDCFGFDWVGAPWTNAEGAHGGNGGFSMRKHSSM